MNIYQTLIIGIVTGILTSAIIWLLINTFQNIFIPWYQSVIYRGTDLEGAWFGVEINEERNENSVLEFRHTINIKQKGHKVKGTILIKNVFTEEEYNTFSEYSFIGEVSDNNILITYQRIDKRTIGMGAYLLKVTGDGEFLEGSSTFMKGGGDIAASNNILLHRPKN